MVAAPRRTLVLIAGVLVLGWIVSSCSSGSSEDAALGTAGRAPAFVDVQMSTFDVTVENRAGEPVIDMLVSIKPVGGFTLYTTRVPRLGSGEKRVLSVNEFTSRDGTPFSLRVVRPKEITVTAVDLSGGKKFAMTTPWKQ